MYRQGGAGESVVPLFLVVAAVIGVWLNLRFHSQMQTLPIKPIIAHALAAVVGFILLLLVLIQT